jgi:hypothetical protein
MPRDKQFRWPQFGLRSLLIVMALFAAWLALTCSRVNNQAAVVREVQQCGGTVWFSDDEPRFVEFWQSPERTRSTELPGPKRLIELFGEEPFRSIVQIDFPRTASAPNNVEQLAARFKRLPQLETLRISSQHVADAYLPELPKLSQLRNLTVDGFPISDDTMSLLGQCRQLETLCLPSTEVSDQGLSHLGKLNRLRCLKLYAFDVTMDGIRSLAESASLQELILYDCDVATSELEQIAAERPGLKANIYYVRRTGE